MILDLIVMGIIVLAFIFSARKGLVKSVWKIAALIITIALVAALRTPTVNFLANTNISDTIYDYVSERLTVTDDVSDYTEEQKQRVPRFLLERSADTEEEVYSVINRGTDAASQKITLWALQIIAAVGLFVLIRVLLSLLFVLADGITKLPVINAANALLGGLLGAVNVLAAIYLVCALISLLPSDSGIYDLINQSYIVKNFYNYNILLQLIM